MEKALLNFKEFCQYLGIGRSKAREIMTKKSNPFTLRIGNRLYANKVLLDKWLKDISGNKSSK
ncbi:MAG: helix-turn-helix domain-containing protein [Lachnospiraceae bacterium]|nr:helix-turn-helix domain-containing protein [Lachnospiraceae bacterium]